MTISQKRSGSLASLCCFRTLTLFFRPAFDSDTAFFRYVFFRPVDDDDELITRVRQQHKTQKQPEQEARDCPNPFFWYATVYAQPAQALAMFAPNVFPLSGAFCLNKHLRHRLGRNFHRNPRQKTLLCRNKAFLWRPRKATTPYGITLFCVPGKRKKE